MDKFFDSLRSMGLKRGPRRIIGGVLGGIADRLNVDPAFVRIVFVILCLLPGPAVLVYLAAWIVIPDQDGRIILEEWVRPKGVGPGGPGAGPVGPGAGGPGAGGPAA
jgi:phage shock protein PspC (stress-responsive transcriptional regulator)